MAGVGRRSAIVGGALAWPAAALARAPLPPSRVDVLIIGAGLGGLATAYGLKKAGVPYHIVELTPRLGGRVRTVHYQRPGEHLYADAGMEEYWESNPAVPLLRELRLPTRADVALSSLIIDGKLEALGDEPRPAFLRRIVGEDGLRAWAALQDLVRPILASLEAVTIPQATLSLKDRAFSDWIEQRRLPRRAAEWIRISIECEAGTTWDQISALDGIAELQIFLGDGERSYRVLGGNERFTDALATAIGRQRVTLGHRVTRIEDRGDRALVHVVDVARDRFRTIEARHVVSTIPLFRLFELQLDPPLPPAKREAIATQSWGAYFKAHLFVPRAAWGGFTKDGASILPLVTDAPIGVVYDGNPDQRTRTGIVSLLVNGPHAESFNLMPLDEVRARLRAEWGRLFPAMDGQVEGIELFRYHPRAVAAWGPGRSRFDALSDELRRPHGRVYLAGDFTEASHSDGAFLAAARVVRQITGRGR